MNQTTLTLHVFPTDDGFFNLSPFCCKAEILLQMAGQPYALSFPQDHKVFPKGKLPVLTDSETQVEDSEGIRNYLESTKGANFTARLSEAEQATGRALCSMLEERSYRALVYSRWVEDDGWSRTRPIFFEGLPDEVADMFRAVMSAEYLGSSAARQTPEEIKASLAADLRALAALLGNTPYFFGDEPSFIDATAFGFIANFYAAPEQTWARNMVAEHANLTAYFARSFARWYPVTAAKMDLSAA